MIDNKDNSSDKSHNDGFYHNNDHDSPVNHDHVHDHVHDCDLNHDHDHDHDHDRDCSHDCDINQDMKHGHIHKNGHKHNAACNHSHKEADTKKLLWAVIVNGLLTFVQIAGGLLSGSLSLIADALHNFSDAMSLALALYARKISRKPPDSLMTFGYLRAEVIGALINLVALVIVAFYIIIESIGRLLEQKTINADIIIVVASIALVIDLITAYLTYQGSKNSMNIRAAFLHNLMDAAGSVAVIISGISIKVFGWVWVDLVSAVLISVYIFWHSAPHIKEAVLILMDAVPENLDIEEIRQNLLGADDVYDVHHLHVRSISEGEYSLTAHIQVKKDVSGQALCHLKNALKKSLSARFNINHSTLEFETEGELCLYREHRQSHSD
jgi:cobalt-zinc-cadmium efflux system protein